MRSILKINGIDIPSPSYGFGITRTLDYVSQTNAKGETVAQKRNRENISPVNLNWAKLTAQEWYTILKEFNKIQGVIEFFDASQNAFVQVDVLFQTSSEGYLFNDENGIPTEFGNCTLTYIDMGTAKVVV